MSLYGLRFDQVRQAKTLKGLRLIVFILLMSKQVFPIPRVV